MERYKVNLKGAVSWSFEFEDQEWFAGFRELATHGIDKPVLNIFRMFGMMNGQRILAQSTGAIRTDTIITSGVKGKNDINAIACVNNNTASIMVWNYHDDDLPATPVPVELTISGINKHKVHVLHYRVDQQFSNSFEKWKEMGKPQNVTTEQYKELEKAGQLQLFSSPEWKKTNNKNMVLKFDMPVQSVSLIRLTW